MPDKSENSRVPCRQNSVSGGTVLISGAASVACSLVGIALGDDVVRVRRKTGVLTVRGLLTSPGVPDAVPSSEGATLAGTGPDFHLAAAPVGDSASGRTAIA